MGKTAVHGDSAREARKPLPVRRKRKLATREYYRLAVGSFFFMQGIVFGSWASRIPDIKNALGLSDAGLGAVLSALPVGQMVAMGLSGYFVGRFGSKRMLTIGILFYPAMLIAVGAASNVWHLAAVLFAYGIFGNMCNISVNTQAIGVERLYGRSIMASFHGLWSLGGFTGGLIGALMVAREVPPVDHFMFIYVAAFTVLFSMRWYMLPRDSRKGGAKTPIFVKPSRHIFTLGVIAFACMICEGTMFDWTGVYFETVVKAPNDLKQLGYVAFMCTMAGGRFVADFFVTHLGIKRVLQISGCLMLTGLLISVIFPNIVMATIGFLLVGFGTSSVVPLVYGLAGKSKDIRPGVALAMVSSIGFLGFLLGPSVIGFIAEASSLRLSFTLIAFLGLCTALLSGKAKAN